MIKFVVKPLASPASKTVKVISLITYIKNKKDVDAGVKQAKVINMYTPLDQRA
jgi:hypothetical protein